MSITTITLQDDTETLLDHWGRWNRGRLTDIGYESQAVFLLQTTSGGHALSEDDALIVDSVVAGLKRKQPEFQKVILLHYRDNLNFSQIGKRLKIGRNVARYYHGCALGWVDGQLETIRAKLAA